MRLYNDMVHVIDNSQVGALVLLDMSAAFDTVDHQIMIDVFQHRFDIRDDALTWFRSYFNDRSQVVKVGSYASGVVLLSTGLPQGSVLGPRSFVCYAEDVQAIFDRQEIKHHLFADDMQGHQSSDPRNADTVVSRLQECVIAVSDWCASERLQLNAKKTEVLWFGTAVRLRKVDPAHICLTIGSDVIQPVDVGSGLGCLLRCSSVDEDACGSSCPVLLLPSSSSALDTTQSWTRRDRLVFASVISRLQYCNSVLVHLPASTLAPLQRVLNAAA